jgi:hypothetical protein
VSTRNAHEVARAFGAILRAARVATGISQEVLAERADCDRTYPSLLERGMRRHSGSSPHNLCPKRSNDSGRVIDDRSVSLH